jgi:hypothetical protein
MQIALILVKSKMDLWSRFCAPSLQSKRIDVSCSLKPTQQQLAVRDGICRGTQEREKETHIYSVGPRYTVIRNVPTNLGHTAQNLQVDACRGLGPDNYVRR